MKIKIRKITLIAGALLCTAGAHAQTWNFNGSPLQGGWEWDTTAPQPFNGQIGNVTFKNSSQYVSTKNGIITFKSGDRKNALMQGAGIERKNTFNTNKMEARCRMVAVTKGNSAANNAKKKEEIRRSQASFWLDTAGPNTVELDAFEIKPGGNVVNFIQWTNGNRNKLHSKSYSWGTVESAQKWTKYSCSTNNRSKFDCFKDGAKRSWTKLNGSTVGNTVVVHNKPWRISQSNLSNGKVASLQCSYVKN